VAKLATLINIHLAVSSLRGNTASNATTERDIDASPPPTYCEVLNGPDSVAVEVRSPGIIDAAECIVTTKPDSPETPEGESLPPPEKTLMDHYLPVELSSLTLEDDHGVSNHLCFFFLLAHVLYTNLVSTLPPVGSDFAWSVSIAGRMVGWCDGSPGTRATSPAQEIRQ